MSDAPGFTLIEFMVVAMLVSLVLAYSVIQFGQANSRRITTEAVNDLKTIIAHARARYDVQKGFAGLDEIHVATGADFPTRLCKNGDCTQGIYSPAFGDVTSLAGYASGPASGTFRIIIAGLSKADCVEVASKIIYQVESIAYMATTVTRVNVLAGSKPAREWFTYDPPLLLGTCRLATNNQMDITVGRK